MSKTESDQDILDEIINLLALPTHPNLLKIVGVCSNFKHEDRTAVAVVTEYQTNGSLDKFLEKFHFRKKKNADEKKKNIQKKNFSPLFHGLFSLAQLPTKARGGGREERGGQRKKHHPF